LSFYFIEELVKAKLLENLLKSIFKLRLNIGFSKQAIILLWIKLWNL